MRALVIGLDVARFGVNELKRALIATQSKRQQVFGGPWLKETLGNNHALSYMELSPSIQVGLEKFWMKSDRPRPSLKESHDEMHDSTLAFRRVLRRTGSAVSSVRFADESPSDQRDQPGRAFRRSASGTSSDSFGEPREELEKDQIGSRGLVSLSQAARSGFRRSAKRSGSGLQGSSVDLGRESEESRRPVEVLRRSISMHSHDSMGSENEKQGSPRSPARRSSVSTDRSSDDRNSSTRKRTFLRRFSPAASREFSASAFSDHIEQYRRSFSNVSSSNSRLERLIPILAETIKYILHFAFSRYGILVCYRIIPACVMVLSFMVSFCPGSDREYTACGDPGFNGIYYEYQTFSIVSLSLISLCFLFVAFECSSFWVTHMQALAHMHASKFVEGIMKAIFVTVQETDISRSKTRRFNRFRIRIFYGISWPIFIVLSEIILAVAFPTRLASIRFFGDYEIFRSVILGTVVSIINIISASLTIASNSVPWLAIALLVLSIVSLVVNWAYVIQFSVDDQCSTATGWLVNCTFPTHAPQVLMDDEVTTEIISEDVGDCPFYRTLRFRKRVDFRAEGQLKDFQLIQLLNSLKVNPTTKRVNFSPKNNLPAALGKLIANQVRQPGMAIQMINMVRLKHVMETRALIETPDTERCRVLYKTSHHEDWVPWNTEQIDWRDGLPWATPPHVRSRDHVLFGVVASTVISLADPNRLEELDLGSNEIGDDCAKQLAELVFKSKKIFNLEIGGNRFTMSGISLVIDEIVRHPTLMYVRLSSVLLEMNVIRTAVVLDLSLPQIYATAVERNVDSIFESCAEVEDLRGSFFEPAVKQDPWSEARYIAKVGDIIGTQYRLVGRDFYRSLTPYVGELCILRAVKRLGKIVVDIPNELIDIPLSKALDTYNLRTPEELETRLYTCLFHEYDLTLIARLIAADNPDIEELDLRGMPLSSTGFIQILHALREKKKLRILNFSQCGIDDPLALEQLILFLINCSDTLAEINLRGNPAFQHNKAAIWEAINGSGTINNPRIVIDNF